MIQILSVHDPAQAREICKKADIEYDENLHISAAFGESGIPKYSVVFQYNALQGRILWLDDVPDDFDITIGLGKAVLSIMQLRGVETVAMDLKFEKIATALGFEKKQNEYLLDLSGYFCCNCQHK